MALLVAGCAADREQLRLCTRLLDALAGGVQPLSIFRQSTDPEWPHGVRIKYRRGAAGEPRWLRCGFAGGRLDRDRLVLARVATSDDGELSDVKLHLLRIWLRRYSHPPERQTVRAVPTGPAYIVQQLINALVPAAIYALIAIGFSLVYQQLQRINLAFGELLTFGAYGGYMAVGIAVGLLPQVPVALVLLAPLISGAIGAVLGWATHRVVFLPLAGRRGQAALIASLGLAIALREAIRLGQSGRDRWLQPILTERLELVGNAGFTAGITLAQLLIAALTGAVLLAALAMLRRGRFGHAYRACADDPGMAALLGVNAAAVAGVTFALAGALAALAGVVVVFYYGGIGPYTGALFVFKALTAAVIGGLTSPAGAIAGAALLALIEALWSAYLPIAWRDIVVFALLASVLILRPQGLLVGGDMAMRLGLSRRRSADI